MEDVDLWRGLYVSELEARLVLCELRCASLNFEIDAPDTTPERRTEAIAERDQEVDPLGQDYDGSGRPYGFFPQHALAAFAATFLRWGRSIDDWMRLFEADAVRSLPRISGTNRCTNPPPHFRDANQNRSSL